MISKIFFSLLSIGFINSVSAFDSSSNSNVAVYWGQNSGLSQERLSTYCNSDSVDVVLLSFLSGFPDTTINFSNQCWTETCPDIGSDIKTCQDNGKAVFLSLGGAAGSYGFSSDAEGKAYAQTLWDTFGAGSDDSITRPFGDAIVDGFDFDIENNDQTGYVALANELKNIYSQDSSKSYYLSASPQCAYPDQNVGDLLSNVELDFAFIQFYNNYCNLANSEFNYNTWESFAESAPNSNIKLYVGLPGSTASASTGYADVSTVRSQLADIKCDSNFGGVALWDASSAFGNDNYQDDIKEILTSDSCTTSSSSIVSSTATTASSSATSSSVVGTSSVATVSSSVIETSSIVTVPSSIIAAEITSSNLPIAPFSNNSITYADPATSTQTNIATTIITVTSCSDNKCSAVAVETGLTTVYEVDTSYVTYCPLSSTMGNSKSINEVSTTNSEIVPLITDATNSDTLSTVTEIVETTVYTITSCHDNKCSPVTITSKAKVDSLIHVTKTKDSTYFTTECPESDKTSIPAPTTIAGNSDSDSTSTIYVNAYQTISTIGTYQNFTNNTIAPKLVSPLSSSSIQSVPVSSFEELEGSASATMIGYWTILIAGIFAALV